MTGTIGVEPITPEIRPLLTTRERKTAAIRRTSAVVARFGDCRPVVLATGRDRTRLAWAAWELALTHGVVCVATPAFAALEPEAGESGGD